LGWIIERPNPMALPSAPITAGENGAPSIEAKVRALRSVATYRPRPRVVQVKQTHLSWLFLTEAFAYKLKKPVAAPPLFDFRSLQARAANCREELRLNRRLAPGVYLGLSCLVSGRNGELALVDAEHTPEHAHVVDWLVRMRRLPEALTLEHAIVAGRLREADLHAVGAMLAAFYRALPAGDLAATDYVAQLRSQLALNAELVQCPQFASDLPPTQALFDNLAQRLERASGALIARVAAGRVVDGHGDLRPEHIFLTEPPVAIDCLEFNRALRQVDWADEIAFLGLECARLGAPHAAAVLRAQLTSALNDPVPDEIFDLYTALRAGVRARLALAHLLEPAPPTPAKWPQLARTYLTLAQAALARKSVKT
jgi:aminoglycoside phosphotransferase family enzyme